LGRAGPVRGAEGVAVKRRQSPARGSGKPSANPVSACLSVAAPRIFLRLVLGHYNVFEAQLQFGNRRRNCLSRAGSLEPQSGRERQV